MTDLPPDIAAVYARIPRIECKGLCAESCGPIGCSAREVDAMLDAGVVPPRLRMHPKLGATCSHLTDEGRCAIYAHRPLVCRLYGVVSGLRCPHGCKREGGYLSLNDVVALSRPLDDGRPDYNASDEARAEIRTNSPPPPLPSMYRFL